MILGWTKLRGTARTVQISRYTGRPGKTANSDNVLAWDGVEPPPAFSGLKTINHCNDFVARVARSSGLSSPSIRLHPVCSSPSSTAATSDCRPEGTLYLIVDPDRHWAQDYALANRELMMRNLIAAYRAREKSRRSKPMWRS
jgi:hypothetical protein